jgi:hypothetical protein
MNANEPAPSAQRESQYACRMRSPSLGSWLGGRSARHLPPRTRGCMAVFAARMSRFRGRAPADHGAQAAISLGTDDRGLSVTLRGRQREAVEMPRRWASWFTSRQDRPLGARSVRPIAANGREYAWREGFGQAPL